MDDMTLIRSFRAERADRDPRARAAAWRELEAVLAPAPSPALSVRRSRRRGVLALAGAGAVAAVVAAIIVLGSGPTAEPAAAEVLHETAAVAASGKGAPALEAGADQYYFTKRKEVEFMGWYPGSYSIVGGPATRPDGFSALIPKETEYWLSHEGGSRAREILGTPRFLSDAEQTRWEEAGSPLPNGFENDGVYEVETPRPQSSPDNFPDLSQAPTDPKELLLAIRTGQAPGISEPIGTPVGMDVTIQNLTSLIGRPNASPALRAAAFNALADLPGFELDRDATDLDGRHGYAISYDNAINGNREEVIIDPETSALLGERSILTARSLEESQWKGYEAGLVLRDVAFLESTVVDSTHEPEGIGRGPASVAPEAGPLRLEFGLGDLAGVDPLFQLDEFRHREGSALRLDPLLGRRGPCRLPSAGPCGGASRARPGRAGRCGRRRG
jgi:hypothetical protein